MKTIIIFLILTFTISGQVTTIDTIWVWAPSAVTDSLADYILPPKAQEFEVTYTITYNSLTLSEAAELEEKIRKEHKDACKVNISVKESNSYPVSSLIDSIFYAPGYRTTLEWEGIK